MECNTIGERIAHLRKVRGISQGDLAKAMYVKREVVTHWEIGDRDLKTDYTIKLADYFGVSCDYLLRGIPSNNLDIARATGLDNRAIERIKEVNQISSLVKWIPQTKVLNKFIGSSGFSQFVGVLWQVQNKGEDLAHSLEQFKAAFIEYEEKPPKDLVKEAARIVLHPESSLNSEAYRVLECAEEYEIALFRLQKRLTAITEEMQREVL